MNCKDCCEWFENLSEDTTGICEHEDSPHFKTTRMADDPACEFGYDWQALLRMVNNPEDDLR